MSYFGVLLVALLNCVILFFASFLAAGGDGSSDGVHMVWWVGFPWIGILTLIALANCMRQRASAALAIAVGTLPVAWAVGLVILFLANTIGIKFG